MRFAAAVFGRNSLSPTADSGRRSQLSNRGFMNKPMVKILLFLSIGAIFSTTSCSTAKDTSGQVSAAGTTSADLRDREIAEAVRMIELAPDSPSGYVQLGAVYVKRARSTGDFALNDKAIAAAERALELAPRDASARKLRASLLLTFHRFSDALSEGEKLLADFPNDAFVFGVLTDANVELGRYPEAVEAAQRMVDLKPNADSYARVAHLRSLHGDHRGAVEMYRTAARVTDPADREAQAWCLSQLSAEYWRNGSYESALQTADEALGILPGFHLALASKGRALAGLGKFEEAARVLAESNNRVPNADVSFLLGDVAAKLGDGEGASRHYDFGVSLENRSDAVGDQKRVAIHWADHGQNDARALEIARIESAIRDDVFTDDALAWTLYKSGDLTGAKIAAAKALRLGTNDARMLFHAGMIEKDLGNLVEARKLLSQALELNPAFDLIQNENARRALIELNWAQRGSTNQRGN